MGAFIQPPDKIPLSLKICIWIFKKVISKDLILPKLLAWYPRAAKSYVMLEAILAHPKKDLNNRILTLAKIQASLTVSCPFCIDINSLEYEKNGISKQEFLALIGKINIDDIATFTTPEILTLEYARYISQTPIRIPKELASKLKLNFTEHELVILASTVAQVNYCARLMQGLGSPPQGFSNSWEL